MSWRSWWPGQAAGVFCGLVQLQLCRRINWRTTGAIVQRVVADQLDDTRLDQLYAIGVDEVTSTQAAPQHHYLTRVDDHDSTTVVCAEECRDAATLTRFLGQVGPARLSHHAGGVHRHVRRLHQGAGRTRTPNLTQPHW